LLPLGDAVGRRDGGGDEAQAESCCRDDDRWEDVLRVPAVHRDPCLQRHPRREQDPRRHQDAPHADAGQDARHVAGGRDDHQRDRNQSQAGPQRGEAHDLPQVERQKKDWPTTTAVLSRAKAFATLTPRLLSSRRRTAARGRAAR
jgi:hypothetical protein